MEEQGAESSHSHMKKTRGQLLRSCQRDRQTEVHIQRIHARGCSQFTIPEANKGEENTG